jgi:hypothetical protein
MPAILSTPEDPFPHREAGALSEQFFLQHTLAELMTLQQEADVHYHGVLARMLAAARTETEMLLREAKQAHAWPDSAEEPLRGIR